MDNYNGRNNRRSEAFFSIMSKFFNNTTEKGNVIFDNKYGNIIIDPSWFTIPGFNDGYLKEILGKCFNFNPEDIREYKIVNTKSGNCFFQVSTYNPLKKTQGSYNIKLNRTYSNSVLNGNKLDRMGIPSISFDELVNEIYKDLENRGALHKEDEELILDKEEISERLIQALKQCIDIYLTFAYELKNKKDEIFRASFDIAQEIDKQPRGRKVKEGNTKKQIQCFSQEELAEIYHEDDEDNKPIAKILVRIKNKGNSYLTYAFRKEENGQKGYVFFAEPTTKSASTRVFYVSEEQFNISLTYHRGDLSKVYEKIISENLCESEKTFESGNGVTLKHTEDKESFFDRVWLFLSGKAERTARKNLKFYEGKYKKLFGYPIDISQLTDRRRKEKITVK